MSRVVLAAVLGLCGLSGAFYLFVHKEYRADAVLVVANVLVDGVAQPQARVFRRGDHAQLLVVTPRDDTFDVLVVDLPSGGVGWTVSSAPSDVRRLGADRLVTSITGRAWKPFSIDPMGDASFKVLESTPVLVRAKVFWPRAVAEPSREAVLTIELK